nr:MAG TPA: hypothetical protein [Caudoviricetes sp.]
MFWWSQQNVIGIKIAPCSQLQNACVGIRKPPYSRAVN